MRAELAEVERRHERHGAVLDLRRAGLLATDGAEKALALFPEPGPKAGALGRALAALLVSGAIGMLAFGLAAALGVRSFTGIALVSAALLVGATEALLASPRLAFSGAAGTAAFWAWAYLVAGATNGLDRSAGSAEIVLVLAAVSAAAAAFRWGVPLHALLAAGALLGLLARAPHGRLLWATVPLLVAPLLARRIDRARVPSHRAALELALATFLFGLYAALNLWSVNEKVVEEIGRYHELPSPSWTGAAWAGTILVPLAVLAWGFLSRRRWLLGLGAAFAALSAVTLREYIHVAPLWEILVAAGAVLALIVLGLIRFLERRREWRGFTDEPLLSRPERGEALGTALLVASQLVHTGPAPRDEEGSSRFASGGGDSGGGGASDRF